jgi:hypothetical protein
MSITTQISRENIEVIFFKLSKRLYILVAFLANLAIIIGILGVIVLISNPTIDEDISQSIVQALIDRYHSLDADQKIQIKGIFSEIFLEK